MKIDKNEEKDPIKDKYNKKISLFKKIQIIFINMSKSLKDNKSFQEDKSVIISSLSSIVVYGAVGSLISTLFGFNISTINFLAIGSFLWLFENKILGFITSILSSIKLVTIGN